MGNLINISNSNTIRYEAIDQSVFKKILNIPKILKTMTIAFLGEDNAMETYYDTSTNLLDKTGIILSRIQEGEKAFFKVESQVYLKNKKISSREVYVHKVGVKDTLMQHAFAIKDGINSMFSTVIAVDFENVLKNVIPKIEFYIISKVYRVTSPTGFRVNIALEERRYNNKETKRKHVTYGVTVKQASPEVYKNDFLTFNKNIEKYFKELILVNENPYDYAKRVTKKIELPPKQKLSRKERKDKESKNN